jgi:hypothetical protein
MNSHQSYKSCRKFKFEYGANTDVCIYQKGDKISRRSKHPLLTGHIHREPHFKRECQ